MNKINLRTALNELPVVIAAPGAPVASTFTPCEPPALDLQIVRGTRDSIFTALHGWLAEHAPADVAQALHQFAYLSHAASEADANSGLVTPDVNADLAIEVWQTMKLSERLARGAE
jgi:hypothetical protein